MTKRKKIHLGIYFGVVLLLILGLFNYKELITFWTESTTLSYYVSTTGNDNNPGTSDQPFATIKRARDKIRELKQAGLLNKPVYVNVKSGTYNLTKPLEFTSDDSGTASTPITYQGYDGPVTFSSGREVASTWSKCSVSDLKCQVFDTASEDQIYYTDLTTDPQFPKDYYFHSLFVNDERSIRARTPNVSETKPPSTAKIGEETYQTEAAGYFHMVSGSTTMNAFGYQSGNLNPNWSNQQDMEVVSSQRFEADRNKVISIGADTVNTKRISDQEFPNPVYGWDYGCGSGNTEVPCNRYYLDNVLEKLDSPGEWYLTKSGILYYYPKTDINQSTIIYPVSQQLMTLQGNEPQYRQDYRNFTVSYFVKTTSVTPSTYIVGTNIDSFGLGLDAEGRMAFAVGQKVNGVIESEELSCGQEIFNDDEWHLATGVFDLNSRQFHCYKDGQKIGSVDLLKSYPDLNQHPPNIHHFIPTQVTGKYVGLLDELNIFNRLLTDAEIMQLANNQLPQNDSIVSSLSFNNNLDDNGRLYQWELQSSSQNYDQNGKFGQAFNFTAESNAQFTVAITKGYITPPPSGFIHDLNFYGLTFAETDWSIPENGYNGSESSVISPLNPTIQIKWASNISIKNSTVKHTGGSGINIFSSDHVNLDRNFLQDIGLHGVNFGEANLSNRSYNDMFYTNNIQISNNKIQNFGQVHPEGIGISALRVSQTNINHNEISNGPFKGISLGWWVMQDIGANTNTIEYNDIHHVMLTLNDGGGIYANGYQSGTIIQNNSIHDINFTTGHNVDFMLTGIYLDDGSQGITVKNNIVRDNSSSFFLQSSVLNNTIQNNIFSNAKKSQLYYAAPVQPNIVKYNIFSNIDKTFLFFGSLAAINTLDQDYNIFFSALGFNVSYFDNALKTLISEPFDLTKWQTTGMDAHSLLANPQFQNGTYKVADNSPALTLGFKQIDISTVGPQSSPASPPASPPVSPSLPISPPISSSPSSLTPPTPIATIGSSGSSSRVMGVTKKIIDKTKLVVKTTKTKVKTTTKKTIDKIKEKTKKVIEKLKNVFQKTKK